MSQTSKRSVENLKKQRDQLNARIQMAEARVKVTERKKDTRRKILVGSYYLEKATKENKWDELKKIMDKFLTRDSDRILFDLSLGTKGNK